MGLGLKEAYQLNWEKQAFKDIILWSREGWGKVRKDKESPSVVANLKFQIVLLLCGGSF